MRYGFALFLVYVYVAVFHAVTSIGDCHFSRLVNFKQYLFSAKSAVIRFCSSFTSDYVDAKNGRLFL